MKISGRAKFFIKLFISVLVFGFLLGTIDANQSIKMLSKINPLVFILMVLIFLLGQFISAYKWQIIADKVGFNYELWQYVNYYFTGMFLNIFLPTSVGGDVAKGYYLCKQDVEFSKTRAFFSIIADRYTGIVVLALLCFLGLFFKPAQDLNLFIKGSIILGFVATFLSTIFISKISSIKALTKNAVVRDFGLCVDRINNKILIKIFGVSIIFHFLMLIIHFCIGQTMGLNIPVSYYLILYPITAIAGFLSISINGIGVRDFAYVYLLSAIAIDPAKGLAFSFCWFMVVFVASLFSAIFYLRNK